MTAHGMVFLRGKEIGVIRLTPNQILDRSLVITLNGAPVKGNWEIQGMTRQQFEQLQFNMPELSVQ